MNDFKDISETNKEGSVLKLVGTLDETTNFGQLILAGQIVTIDMENITRINSIGIRDWIIWHKKHTKGKELSFVKVVKNVVDQINLVSGFLPAGSKVISFFVPYWCEACESNLSQLFQFGSEFEHGAIKTLPVVSCPSCKNAMELDVDPDRYFRFLKSYS